MAIAFSNLGASANPDINANFGTPAYDNFGTPAYDNFSGGATAFPTSDLIIVFVFNRIGAGTANQPTISGNGLTWTAIKSVTLNP